MMMPCLPAYGGHHHYWLKAVRKQQAAYAALLLEDATTENSTELPDSNAEALAVVTAVAGVATNSSDSTTAPLMKQALDIANQHGFPSPGPVSILEASMPRSKPEKQANKQAMATVSTQLDPAHIKLQPRTPDHPQQPPRQPASSPELNHLLLTEASRIMQPFSLAAVAKQQLLSFCSTASCSMPLSAHGPQAPGTEPLPVHSDRETCWSSRSSIILEEPIICNAAAADRPWHTARAEAVKHPDQHNMLTFKVMSCAQEVCAPPEHACCLGPLLCTSTMSSRHACMLCLGLPRGWYVSQLQYTESTEALNATTCRAAPCSALKEALAIFGWNWQMRLQAPAMHSTPR